MNNYCNNCKSNIMMITGISGDIKNVCDVSFNFEDGTSKTVSMEEGKKYTVTYLNNDGIVEVSTGTLLGILYQEDATEYRADTNTIRRPMQSGPIHRKVFSPPPPLPGLGALPPDHRHCWIGFPQPYCDPNNVHFTGAVYHQGSCQPNHVWTGPYSREKTAQKELINPMHVHQEYPIVTSGSTIGFTFDCSSEGSSVAKTIMLTVIRDLEKFDILDEDEGNKVGSLKITISNGENVIYPTFYSIPGHSISYWNLCKDGVDLYDDDISIAYKSIKIDYNIEDSINNGYQIILKDSYKNKVLLSNIYITDKSYLSDGTGCEIRGIIYFKDNTDTSISGDGPIIGDYHIVSSPTTVDGKIAINLINRLALSVTPAEYYSIYHINDEYKMKNNELYDNIESDNQTDEENSSSEEAEVTEFKLTDVAIVSDPFDESVHIVSFYDENKNFLFKAKMIHLQKIKYSNLNVEKESEYDLLHVSIGFLVKIE